MSIIRNASILYLSFICSFSVFSWTKRAFEKGRKVALSASVRIVLRKITNVLTRIWVGNLVAFAGQATMLHTELHHQAVENNQD